MRREVSKHELGVAKKQEIGLFIVAFTLVDFGLQEQNVSPTIQH